MVVGVFRIVISVLAERRDVCLHGETMKRFAFIVGIIGLALHSCAPVSEVAPSALAPGTVFRDCPECPEMVVIPAGSFIMGSPESEKGRSIIYEGPQHRVIIPRAFALGKYEVTFAEWDACARGGGCNYRPSDRGWGRGNRPVINVSWDEAKTYLRWLSGKTGKEYRLPSEAEWEYAARAGTKTARFWGENYSSACGYGNVHDLTSRAEIGFTEPHHNCRDGYAQTAPVGSFRANDFGLYDVLGNVWEWVEDCWHKTYSGAPSNGDAWTTGECPRRIMRGGSWSNAPWHVRAAHRRGAFIGPLDRIGFRIARTLP